MMDDFFSVLGLFIDSKSMVYASLAVLGLIAYIVLSGVLKGPKEKGKHYDWKKVRCRF